MNKLVNPVLILLCLFWAIPVHAHESQPGTLTIEELGPQKHKVIWQAPIYYGKPHPAQLVLPDDWTQVGEATQRRRTNDIVHTIVVSTPESLNGQVVRLPGLEATITDVFVRLNRADGSSMSSVARPTKPWVELRGEKPWHEMVTEYLFLGFHHILLGIDHLLFVLGLLLIVKGRRMLLKTITSFTVAHSITLGAATLGLAQIPQLPLNAAIALSILFLGPEIVRAKRGESSLTIKYPWIIAFGFGLLHGFGFASGLSTTGMPQAELPWALLWFNVGVEFGQLLFVFLALSLAWSFRVLEVRWPRWALWLPGYTVGGMGAYWTIQRTVMMFGGL